jgi:hypothetical protein
MTGLEISFRDSLNIPFDEGVDQKLVCKISDHLLTLFFFLRIIILIVKNDPNLNERTNE